MSATEIILIVIGVAVFLLGYLMPARKKDLDEEVQLISEDEVRKLVAGEVEHVKERISDIVDETVNYSIEKAERAMERVTNEKIMAINEYSDTVLEEINKNHKEVVFLYDMLNDKHDNLMSAINEATMAADDIRQTVKDAEITAGEAGDRLDAVMQAIDDAEETIREAENAAVQVQRAADQAMHTVVRAVENAKSDIMSLRGARPYQAELVEEVIEEAVSRPAQTAEAVRHTAGTAEYTEQTSEIPQADAFTEVLQEEAWNTQTQQTDLHGTGPARTREEKAYDADMSGGEVVYEEEYAEEPPVRTAFTGKIVREQPVDPAEFKPISPRRVEIIHQPDGDYVADNAEEMTTSEAFASMGIFAPKPENPEEAGRRARTRRSFRRERTQDSVSAMDIRFAQGKDNGRNSNERILELHKAGKSNMAIAKELGLGLGEVKLVIDLFEGF